MRRLISVFALAGAVAACDGPAADGPAPAPTAAPAPTQAAPADSAVGGARSVSEETDDFLFEFSYPAAAGRIPELATVLDVMLEQRRGELARQAAEALREARDNGFPYNKHSFSAEWKVVAELPDWLSLSADISTYSGGAHGNYTVESLVWDKQAKAGMDGVALFQSAEALDEALGQKLCDALDAERAKRRGEAVPADAGDDATGFNSCQHVKDATVLVGSSGGGKFDRIGVWFGPYVAGPYAEGSYELNFPVDAAVIEAVKPEYREAFAAKK